MSIDVISYLTKCCIFCLQSAYNKCFWKNMNDHLSWTPGLGVSLKLWSRFINLRGNLEILLKYFHSASKERKHAFKFSLRNSVYGQSKLIYLFHILLSQKFWRTCVFLNVSRAYLPILKQEFKEQFYPLKWKC